MSIFFNSFKREIGKNSGKWLSNLIFKDNHSTPVKIIRENKKAPVNKAKDNTVIIDFAKNEKNILIEKKNSVLEKELPNDKTKLFDYALNLITIINTKKWSLNNSTETENTNKYLDAHFEKLKQVRVKLEFMNAEKETNYIKTELKKIKLKRTIQKYWVFILFVALISLLSILK